VVQKSRHPVWQFFNYHADRNASICSIENCTTTLSGKYTTNLKKHLQSSHPAVFQQFAEMEKLKTSEQEDPFSGSQVTLSSQLFLQLKYIPDHKKQMIFENDIAMWALCSSTIPTNIGDNADFKMMIHNVDPKLEIPKRKKLNSLMDEKMTIKKIAETELRSARKVTLSLDIWTRRGLTTSYLGVIATFFNFTRMEKMAITLAVK